MSKIIYKSNLDIMPATTDGIIKMYIKCKYTIDEIHNRHIHSKNSTRDDPYCWIVKSLIGRLKYYELLTPEIEHELMPFVFGEADNNS